MTDDREYLKGFLQDFANANLEKSKSGLYCCPLCGSGTGKNKTGAFGIYANGLKWSCRVCGKGGDLIDLIGEINHTDPAESFKIARELYGGTMQTAAARAYATPAAQHTQEAQGDFTEYIESSRKALKKSPEAMAYLRERGISETTAARSLVGDEATRSIVLPYDRQGRYYTRRAIDRKEYRKPPAAEAGSQPLYNCADLYNAAAAPVFIVEGEIDALSVIEAGGHAVALAGAKNSKKLTEQIQRKTPAGVLVIALDNDEAGQAAADELAQLLKPLGVPFLQANISGGHKDANEALTANRSEFIATIRATERQAMDAAARDKEREREEYRNRSAKGFIKQFTEDIAHSAANTAYTPTGFEKLDSILDGGLFEGLCVVGAISSLGKTTFCLQVADQIAANNNDVLIFSLEMARSELMAKSISRESLLFSLEKCGKTTLAKTTRGITTGKRWENYTNDEAQAIYSAIRSYAQYAENLYISEGIGDIGVKEIRQEVAEHIRITGNKPVVIIDYLQILAPHDPRASDKQNTDKAVLELKRMSRDFKIPVIAISSLNRQSYAAPIGLEAFKESGAIEYGSDIVIGLQAKGAGESGFDVDEAKRKDPREIELKILKNRNGRTGESLYFEYYPLFNYYKESGAAVQQQSGRVRERR